MPGSIPCTPIFLKLRRIRDKGAGTRPGTTLLKSHRDGLHLSVLLQSIFAQFPADAGLFKTPKRRSRIQLVVAVSPARAGAHVVRDGVRLLNVTSPDAGSQSIDGTVGPLDHFIELPERDNAHHRSEDFLAGNFHFVLDVRENGRFDEVAARSDSVAAACEGCSLTLSRFNVLHDVVELCLIDLRTLLGRRVEGISDHALARASYGLFQELIVNGILDEDP